MNGCPKSNKSPNLVTLHADHKNVAFYNYYSFVVSLPSSPFLCFFCSICPFSLSLFTFVLWSDVVPKLNKAVTWLSRKTRVPHSDPSGLEIKLRQELTKQKIWHSVIEITLTKNHVHQHWWPQWNPLSWEWGSYKNLANGQFFGQRSNSNDMCSTIQSSHTSCEKLMKGQSIYPQKWVTMLCYTYVEHHSLSSSSTPLLGNVVDTWLSLVGLDNPFCWIKQWRKIAVLNSNIVHNIKTYIITQVYCSNIP